MALVVSRRISTRGEVSLNSEIYCTPYGMLSTSIFNGLCIGCYLLQESVEYQGSVGVDFTALQDDQGTVLV